MRAHQGMRVHRVVMRGHRREYGQPTRATPTTDPRAVILSKRLVCICAREPHATLGKQPPTHGGSPRCLFREL